MTRRKIKLDKPVSTSGYVPWNEWVGFERSPIYEYENECRKDWPGHRILLVKIVPDKDVTEKF